MKLHEKILFFVLKPFYNERYWTNYKQIKHSSYSAEELFVFSSIGWICAGIVASLYPLIFFGIKYNEIVAFNKVCNTNIQFLEGIFLELRVDNCVNKNNNF